MNLAITSSNFHTRNLLLSDFDHRNFEWFEMQLVTLGLLAARMTVSCRRSDQGNRCCLDLGRQLYVLRFVALVDYQQSFPPLSVTKKLFYNPKIKKRKYLLYA